MKTLATNTFTMKTFSSLILSASLAVGSLSVNAATQTETTAIPSVADSQAAPNFVIYRPKQTATMSGINYRVYVDGKRLAKLRVGSHQVLNLSPGQHTLSANDRNRSKLKFIVNETGTTIVRAAAKSTTHIVFDTADMERTLKEAPAVAKSLRESDKRITQL